MRRLILIAALIAAVLYSHPAFAAKTHVGASADFPTVNGYPPMFGTIASGTGTSTVYIEVIPVGINATTGAILVDLSSGSVKMTASSAIYTFPVAQTNGTSSAILLTAAPQYLAPLAGQRFMSLFATGTWEYGIGTFASAITNRPAVYNKTIVGSYGVSVWTTATPAYLAVDKVGD